ncbi:MAG: LPS export ABC transporter permease LptG [Myxococcales bacterium]|nr:MAG: LPS export ABC transporter permease LptG [Myxococcales bacterium]
MARPAAPKLLYSFDPMRILARYIVGQYLAMFGLCMALTTGVFVLGDFFSDVSDITEYNSTAPLVVAYFLLRIPKAVLDTYPAAALLACLVSVGLLTRHREILAMRACGVGTLRLATPLLLVSVLISLVMLLFSETIVPPMTARARAIKQIDIKGAHFSGAYNASSIWFQDTQGFFNVDYYDHNRGALYGVTLYEADSGFVLDRVIEVEQCFWRNDQWEMEGGTVKEFGSGGEVFTRPLKPGEMRLRDPPSEFKRKRRKADEFSYTDLRRQIGRLHSRGVDVLEFEVDLQRKLAVPFSGLIAVLLGFPVAVRGGRRSNLAASIAIGLGLSFAYWVTMGVCVALGHNGDLPPIVAAWLGNALFGVLGTGLYMGAEGY